VNGENCSLTAANHGDLLAKFSRILKVFLKILMSPLWDANAGLKTKEITYSSCYQRKA
jgi:hypothetical protein